MNLLNRLEKRNAIQLWEEQALTNVKEPKLALNPYLYDFYSDYLDMSPYYLILYRGDHPAALLPIVLDGKRYCSLPHLSYGGLFWLNQKKGEDTDEEIISSVVEILDKQKPSPGFYRVSLDEISQSISSTTVDIEIRNENRFFETTETGKSIQFISLKPSFDEQAVLFGSNLRRKLSKAQKNGIVVKKGGPELIPDFAKVYNRNIQRIGSPTLGKSFFLQLAKQKELQVEIFVAYLKDKPVGGGFCMWYDGYYENTWFATLDNFNNLYTSYLLHGEMIKSAIAKKATTYSLGRSTKGSGVHTYKLQWPVTEKDLYFSRTKTPGISLKDQKWMSTIWKQLPSLFVDSLGPFFAKRMY